MVFYTVRYTEDAKTCMELSSKQKLLNKIFCILFFYLYIWDGLRWVGAQSEAKAANKGSALQGTPSKQFCKNQKTFWLLARI